MWNLPFFLRNLHTNFLLISVIACGRSWSLVVAHDLLWSLGVAPGRSWSLGVTPGRLWSQRSLVVAPGGSWMQVDSGRLFV